jgi:hypothetical protein
VSKRRLFSLARVRLESLGSKDKIKVELQTGEKRL